MVNALLSILGVLTAIFTVVFGKDIYVNKNNLEKETNGVIVASIGVVTNFFDALGIGNFATITASLRALKQIQDRVIPGTLNVCSVIPVAIEAFAFITVIEVEPLTLISMLVAAIIGSLLGAGYVAKMQEKKIQFIMGIALLVTAFLMFAGQMGWIAGIGTGNALGLSGSKLVIAIIGNFILGALMTAGVGLYAPCMALVYMLGMSPTVAFPIMMGSCAFLMPLASIKFIKEGAYNRKASLVLTISGIFGILIAVYLVKSLPIRILKWLVIVVVSYTAVTLLKDYLKSADVKEA